MFRAEKAWVPELVRYFNLNVVDPAVKLLSRNTFWSDHALLLPNSHKLAEKLSDAA